MRRILAIIPAAALAAVLLAQTQPAPKAASKKSTGSSGSSVTPRKAGEFVIHMPNGSQQLLSSYLGKVIVLAFMHTTCEHCQHMAGVLARVQTEYAAKGVQVLGVTFDPQATQNVANFIKTFGVNYPCGYSTEDQVIKFLHGPKEGYYVPILAFIDRAGTVRSQYLVTEPGDDPSKFLSDPDVNIRKELDKYLKTSAHPPAKQAPKS